MTEEGGRGGGADYVGALAPALARLGQPIELITAADHRYAPTAGVRIRPWFHYLRSTSRLSRLVRRLGFGRVLNGMRFLFAYLRCAPLARRSRLVHIQGGESPPLEVVAMCLFRAAGAAIVHTPHNTFDRYNRNPRALRLLESLATRTIVHANADLANLSRPKRGVVIPHGEYGGLARSCGPVDRESAREDLGLNPDAPMTLVFGQLRPDKGIRDVLIAAREIPALHVVLAGEDVGGLETATDLLRDPVLSSRVIIREGFHDMNQVASLFAAADTVSLAYRQASQSGVLLLAYGFERPVVVYPTGGLPEAVIDGETGWICASPDPAALAVTLRDAIRDGWAECRRRGAAGARLAEERYSWDEIARRTLEVYDDVAA